MRASQLRAGLGPGDYLGEMGVVTGANETPKSARVRGLMLQLCGARLMRRDGRE